MKAYILVQTRYGGSTEVIFECHNNHGKFFVQGRPVYGWYDAIVELEIPNTNILREITEELRKNQPDITQIGTIVERTDDK
ncbi:MAG: hypothetical protein QG670_482 [Thermoproteota archaeon]|nr:hypothetical protein [Thermoproteota archaeon]